MSQTLSSILLLHLLTNQGKIFHVKYLPSMQWSLVFYRLWLCYLFRFSMQKHSVHIVKLSLAMESLNSSIITIVLYCSHKNFDSKYSKIMTDDISKGGHQNALRKALMLYHFFLKVISKFSVLRLNWLVICILFTK